MKESQPSKFGLPSVSRRSFVKSVAGAGAGLALVQPTWVKAAQSKEQVNVALIGCGVQGTILLNWMLRIPGVRIKAICDIFEFNRVRASGLCRKANQGVADYMDYQEMLQNENLDAVVIATPDFVHAEMTNACLEAGLHVYCEKEMSNDIEKARSMVLTARKTGKLLQIGHQRRSNPFYQHAYRLTNEAKLFGAITHVNGQWNQAKPIDIGWPKRYELDEATLNKYGYETMGQLRNWRWFRKFAGGPMADLGSHQVDIFNWFLNAVPKSVYAIGSNARAIIQGREENASFTPECEDNVMCLYEWDTPEGVVRGFYQVILSSSHGGFWESFMGTQGSFVISEITTRNAMFREARAPKQDWESEAEKIEVGGAEAMNFDPLKSRKAQGKMDEVARQLEESLDKPVHQVHLENFFAAIRDGEKLTCPAEVGFETAVTVLKVNEALRTGKKVEFSPNEFKV